MNHGEIDAKYLNRKLKVLEGLCDDFSDMQVLELLFDDENRLYCDRIAYCMERLGIVCDDLGIEKAPDYYEIAKARIEGSVNAI